MEQSESIKELATALCAAQAKFESAKKNSLNPHFKAKYADLAEVWDAARKALTDNGLSVSQIPGFVGERPVLFTQLMHTSGEYIRGPYPLIVSGDNPQKLGSAVTYARRYAFCSVTGMTAEDDDDDGNQASKKSECPLSEEERAEYRSLIAEASQMKWDDERQQKFIQQHHDNIKQFGQQAWCTAKHLEAIRSAMAKKRTEDKSIKEEAEQIMDHRTIDDEIRY